MPSDTIVRCARVDAITEHPHADNLLILDILGWQVITNRDTNPKVGELRVFIAPDLILPQELAEQLGVTVYLKNGNRVRQVKLRGIMSFGIAASNHWNFQEGEEVSEQLGITKYSPPEEFTVGDQAREHPLFTHYSNIENFRNFPKAFEEGEVVAIYEKIEGTNSRMGGVRITEAEVMGVDQRMPIPRKHLHHETFVGFMIGSHSTQKKFEAAKPTIYASPYNPHVRDAICKIMYDYNANVVIFFGEIFGRGIKNGARSMTYGRNTPDWRLFDIYIDGRFAGVQELTNLATLYGLELAPLLYCGPFSLDALKLHANQPTQLMDQSPHLSEGVVIKPLSERVYDGCRRLLLKYKSDAYEELKAKGKAG